MVCGSSRSFMYSVLPFGGGIARASSTKPSGTLTGLAKSASVLTESSRKSLSPLRVHCFSGSEGQRTPVRRGTRTRFTSDCQSPLVPSPDTGRNFKGPKAEGPSSFIGSSAASTVLESCGVRLPSLKLSVTRKDSSAVATSTFSEGGKVSGACLCKKRFRWPSCATSSWLPRPTAECEQRCSTRLLLLGS